MKHIALKITALIFGIALWFYVISLKDFQVEIQAPVILAKLPENVAVSSKPPQTLPITLEGKAFDLIRLRSHEKSAFLLVDMHNAELGPKRISIDSKNFMSPGFTNIRFIEPENQLLFIDVELDTRINRNVPIRLETAFEAAPGYLMADVPKVIPEELQVSGARNTLTRIIDIPTDSIKYDSLTSSQEFTIPLNFKTLPAYVNPSDTCVKVAVNVQKIKTKTFKKIPVHLIGHYNKDAYKLSPDTVTVEVTGAEQIIDSMQVQNFDLFLEINRFKIEDLDSLPPTANLRLGPEVNRELAIKAIQIKPEKVTLQEIVQKPVVETRDSTQQAVQDSTQQKDTETQDPSKKDPSAAKKKNKTAQAAATENTQKVAE